MNAEALWPVSITCHRCSDFHGLLRLTMNPARDHHASDGISEGPLQLPTRADIARAAAGMDRQSV
jgi:hypothetical protein